MQNYDEVIHLVNQPIFKQNNIKKNNNAFRITQYGKKFCNTVRNKNYKDKENIIQNFGQKTTSKFVLFNIINNARKTKSQWRIECSIKIYKFFEDQKNLEKLFTSKYELYQKRCLKFRSYNKAIDYVPEEIQETKLFFKVQNSCAQIVKNILIDNGLKETKSNSKAILIWSNGSIKLDQYQKLLQFQKINHHPFSNQITRKDFLFINFMKIKQKFKNHFDFVPNSYLLPQDSNILIRNFQKKNQQIIMICKPVASSQGKGIFLESNPDNVNQQDFRKDEYIKNPLLINNLKFDLRIYVAVTSIDPLKIFIYKEGLARFATEPYKIDKNNFDVFTHLTNFSINKNNDKFFTSNNDEQQGYKWSLKTLEQRLKQKGIDWKKIFKQIEDIVIKTFLSIEQKLFKASEKNLNFKNNCFELFGFDILIDENLKAWLIEVNLAPSLGCSTQLDFNIKKNLVKDLLNLSGLSSKNKIKKNIAFGNKTYLAYNSAKLNSQFNQDKKIEQILLSELKSEIKRCGNFKLIYPSYNVNYYNQFYEEKRRKNQILLKTINKNISRLKLEYNQSF